MTNEERGEMIARLIFQCGFILFVFGIDVTLAQLAISAVSQSWIGIGISLFGLILIVPMILFAWKASIGKPRG